MQHSLKLVSTSNRWGQSEFSCWCAPKMINFGFSIELLFRQPCHQLHGGGGHDSGMSNVRPTNQPNPTDQWINQCIKILCMAPPILLCSNPILSIACSRWWWHATDLTTVTINLHNNSWSPSLRTSRLTLVVVHMEILKFVHWAVGGRIYHFWVW